MKLLYQYYLRRHKCRIVLYDYVDIEPIVIYRGSYTLGYLNGSVYLCWPGRKYRHCAIVGE